jgi:hypothetical protein
MIKKCNKCKDYRCAAAVFQDEKYGEGMRVHNKFKSGNETKGRCTVCEEERSL